MGTGSDAAVNAALAKELREGAGDHVIESDTAEYIEALELEAQFADICQAASIGIAASQSGHFLLD